MQRVMIVGQPGSGKSTLARRLGERTGLPVVHIDTIHGDHLVRAPMVQPFDLAGLAPLPIYRARTEGGWRWR